MGDDPFTEVRVGDTTVFFEPGQVLIYDDGGDSTELVGAITAAGLQDAARLDDDVLRYLGGLAHAAEGGGEADE